MGWGTGNVRIGILICVISSNSKQCFSVGEVMDCNFYVGQKVICVDADDTNELGIQELTQGAQYTVAWVGVVEGHLFKDLVGQVAVYLEEVPARPIEEKRTGHIFNMLLDIIRQLWGDGAGGFRHYRFRPVTDISELEQLLKTTPVDTPKKRVKEDA
jgi:hypothetical protein